MKGTVLPSSDQQAGFTLGGPIIRNKVHFFASCEMRTQPAHGGAGAADSRAKIFEMPLNTVQGNTLANFDFQQSPKNSYTFRVQRWTSDNPQAISSGNSHPNAAESDRFLRDQPVRHLVARREQPHGASGARRRQPVLVVHADPLPFNSEPFYNAPFGVPVFQFPNLTLGGQQNEPNYTWQTEYSARGDVTMHRGRHELKFGAEFLKDADTKVWDLNRRGTFVFNKQPSAAILEADFPAATWNQPLSWNISNLQPYLQEYDVFFNPNNYLVDVPRPYSAAWFGDNWQMSNDLTVNLGIRYDLDLDGLNPPGVTNTPIMINDGFYPAGNYGYQTGVKALNDFGAPASRGTSAATARSSSAAAWASTTTSPSRTSRIASSSTTDR